MIRTCWKWTWRLGLALLLLFVAYNLWLLGHVLWWRSHNPTRTAFMEQGLDRLQEKNPNAQLRHRWVAYDQLSVHLKRALIASEDAKFADHDGFDWDALEKAYEQNLKKGKPVRGGSTISQQLAKNLFLSPRKSYVRKAEEALITVMLEQFMSKRRILEIYLNVIEWGDGIYGADAAAQYYFKSSAAKLRPAQAARLAALVPNPKQYGKAPYSRYLNGRTAVILQRMSGSELPE